MNDGVIPINQKGFRSVKQPTRAKVIEQFSDVANQVKEVRDALNSISKIVFLLSKRIGSIEQRLDTALPFSEFRTSGLIKLLTDKNVITIPELSDACSKEELDYLNKNEPTDDKKFDLHVVDRPAQQGDIVLLSYIALDEESNLVPGLSTEWLQTSVGKSTLDFVPTMIPELTDALVGMSANSAKEVPVSFPADFKTPELAGKTINFRLSVKRVKEHRPADRSTPVGGNIS